MSFQSRSGVTKLAACTQPRPTGATPSFAEYPIWRAITGSPKELIYITELYTYGLDRKLATATSIVKSG